MKRALLALLLVTCSEPQPPLPTCSGIFPSSTNPTYVLSTARISISFALAGDCTQPTRATASVLDPRSNSLDAAVTLEGRTVTVSFDPVGPGAHHVTVRFQPNLGLAQTDVTVVLDRSREDGGIIPDFANAYRIELTDAGLLVADSDVYRVLPDGSVRHVTRLVGDDLLIAPHALWTRTGQQLTRHVPVALDDGGLELPATPAEAVTFASDETPFAGDLDVALGSPDGSVVQVSMTLDGGWSRRVVDVPIALDTVTGRPTWLHRLGDELIASTGCGLDLSTGRETSCTDLGLTSSASRIDGDTAGVWTGAAFSFGGVPSFLFFRGPDQASGSLTLMSPADLTVSPAPRLRIRDLELVAAWGPDGITLEYWGDIVAASQHTLATRLPDQRVLVRRR